MTPTRLRLVTVLLALALAGADEPRAPEPGKDRHGDPLPAAALARLGTAHFRHAHNIMSLALSPDGKTLASAANDHRARLWDLATGRELRAFGPKAEQDKPFHVSRWVHAVAFSPDGKLLATGEFANGWSASTLRLWEVKSGRQLVARNTGTSGVVSLAFSPDGKTLALAGATGSVRLLNAPGLATSRQLGKHTGRARKVAFSPDGKYLASAGDDGAVLLWDLATRKSRRVGQHAGGAQAVAFSPDGKLLASGGADRVLSVRQVAGGKEVWRARGGKPVRCVAWSPDGKTVACGVGAEAVLHDALTGKERKRLTIPFAEVVDLVFSADGKKVAGCAFPHNAVYLWAIDSGKLLGRGDGHRGGLQGPGGFSADGKVFTSVGSDGTVRNWDPATGRPLGLIETGHANLTAVSWQPTGRMLACARPDKSVSLFDRATGERRLRWPAHKKWVVAVALSPDEKLVASASGSSVFLWEAATGKRKEVFPDAKLPVSRLLFSPDGKSLAVGYSREVRLFAVGSGKQRLRLAVEAVSLAFSPDGTTLATGGKDGTAVVWEVASGRAVHTFPGHTGYVLAVAFSPDGRTLAVGNWMNARLYELATGQERLRLATPQGDVCSLAFDPAGRRLASGGSDTTTLVWDLTGRLAGGRLRPGALTDKEFEKAWEELGGADAVRAYQALWALAADPKRTLARLREQLRPAKGIDAKRVARLIADLDHDDFAVREKASQELAKLGPDVAPALRKAIEGDPTVELYRRVTDLLDKLGQGASSPGLRRMRRALEVLEQIDTPAARAWLKRLAEGAPGSWVTTEARAALRRRGGAKGSASP
jgi:WD40 repeat protein